MSGLLKFGSKKECMSEVPWLSLSIVDSVDVLEVLPSGSVSVV